MLFLRRLLNFRAALVAVIAVFLILTILSKQYEYFPFDLWITTQIQLINIPAIDLLLRFITWMGNPASVIYSLIVVSGAIFLYGHKRESLMLIFSTVGALALSESLKLIISRPRPDAEIINQVEKYFGNSSYPSGHVLFFMGFYGYLMYLSFVRLRKRQIRYFFTALFLTLIVLVGLSRVYLGSHWFSDVLGAYLIGSVWLYIVILISNRLKR